MKRKFMKKFLAAVLAITLAAGSVPAVRVSGAGADELELNNGFIKVEVSGSNGGFAIRTVNGDIINKDDNSKDLLFHDGVDDTSFTSFQVTRNGKVNEYIFGGEYPGSSQVTASRVGNEIIAKWSVDDLTFTETISLVNSGSAQHGMVYINYKVENNGAPADVKARILMDTALGAQDYAYYNIGDPSNLVIKETMLTREGYSKSFFALDDCSNPSIVAYTVNASVNNEECVPYQTAFAHWNGLATTVFDYVPDETVDFTRTINDKYTTADSAFALYFDMGNIMSNASSAIATNYGVFSNEKVDKTATAAVNLIAPETLELADNKLSYKNDGKFSIKTDVQNISENTYEKVRILVYTTGGIMPLDEAGNPTNATYEQPYTKEFLEYTPELIQSLDWKFAATPQETGIYAKVTFKVYDVSNDSTMGTNDIIADNLLGEGSCYILCPGTVTKVPEIRFTGASPEILYSKGTRNLYVTGSNFSMLADKGAYNVTIAREDGNYFNGVKSVKMPTANVKIDEENDVINLVMTDEDPGELPEGKYRITFDYTDRSKKDLTAPALTFQVKDETKYKNDSYGLVAVVKDENRNYHIKSFGSESDYKNAINNNEIDRDKALLEFRGEFTQVKTDDGSIKYSGVSLGSGDNVMTLNNCLDIEDGETIITEKDGSVCVDFDAKIYTTGARTGVWSGVCALTELEAGRDFGLIPYDEDGERKPFSYNTITLLWPSVGQAAQNLLGFLMDLRYGELGAIKHDGAEDTRVVAFGAGMSLGFAIPDYAVNPAKQTPLQEAHSNLMKARTMDGNALRNINKQIPYNSSTKQKVSTGNNSGNNNNNNKDNGKKGIETPTGKVQIDDVLFGGQYLGVNLTIKIGVPSYVEGMAKMEGTLTVKTVGDWSVGVKGVLDYKTFIMEAEIAIKSKNNFAVPDKIKFFVGNMVPGINLDGFGVLWLQGAGGGIDKLYDTIFLSESIPPLTLILEAQFSLMQVISARASLELSLRGIGVELSDGKVLDTIKVLNSAKLKFMWYPEFSFLTSVDISIFDAIKGGGYIVVEGNGFFEFFLRAALQIPESVPIVGGIQVGSASLGANADKIWGAVEVLSIDFGVVYYWGSDSVDWGSGAAASPSYPELVGMAKNSEGLANCDTPVYYDAETGRTLYMHVGTNISGADKAVVMDEAQYMTYTKLAGTIGSGNSLTSCVNGFQHMLELDTKINDEILTITWDAESMEEARKYIDDGKVTIVETGSDDSEYPLNILDHNKNTEEQPDANANLTFDEESKKATLSVTFTEPVFFGKSWQINTEEYSSVLLYDVNPLPKLSDDTAYNIDTENEEMTVTLHGDMLDKFDTINFIAVPSEENLAQSLMSSIPFIGSAFSNRGILSQSSGLSDEEKKAEGRLLYHIENGEGFSDGQQVTFDIPKDLRSGGYQLRILATDENAMYESSVEKEMIYINRNQPAAVNSANIENAGDYRLSVNLEAPENIDGYSITVYDSEGNAVEGMTNMLYYSNGEGLKYNQDGTIESATSDADNTTIKVGGQYQIPLTITQSDIDNGTYSEDEVTTDADGNMSVQVTKGLFAGNTYTVGISTWKKTSDGKSMLYSNERKTDPITVAEPVSTSIMLAVDSVSVDVTETRTKEDGSDISFTIPTYKEKDLDLVLQANNKISGTWTLDGGEKEGTTGTIDKANETQTIVISQTDLEEGVHTLTFRGINEHGDGVYQDFVFGIDTLAPRLLLGEPVNGALFDRATGKLVISGVTDNDTVMTINNLTTEEILVRDEKVDVDNEGIFTKEISLDSSLLAHKIRISLKDKVGNEVKKDISVINDGLCEIKDVQVWSGNRDITNTVLKSGDEYSLNMKALLKDGSLLDLGDNELVEWSETSAEGKASINNTSAGPVLVVPEDGKGMVTGRFVISDEGAFSVSAAFGSSGVSGKADTPETILYNGEAKKEWYLEEDGDVDITAPGYMISDTPDGEYHVKYTMTYAEDGNLQKTLYFKNAQGQKTDGIAVDVNYDRTAPTAEIAVETNKWNTFLDTISFGLLFKETKEVTITATDAGSGIASTKYYVANTAVSEADIKTLNDSEWTEGNNFRINPDNRYVVYAKVSDNVGHTIYISSDGMIVDESIPTVELTLEGTAYTGASAGTNVFDGSVSVKVEVSDNENGSDLDKIIYTLDGGTETEIANGRNIAINEKGVHTVIVKATDKAGNVSAPKEITVSVYVEAPEITMRQIGKVSYDGSAIEAGKDFAFDTYGNRGQVSYSYKLTKDSYGQDVQNSQSVSGLPTEAGTYTVTANVSEDTENLYKACTKSCRVVIDKGVYTAQPFEKSFGYYYSNDGETIDLTKLVPAGSGNMEYSFVTGSSEIGGAGSTIILHSVDNGLLTFDLKEMTSYEENTYKTFKVKVSNANYEDFEIQITIKREECEHPSDKLTQCEVKEPTCTEKGYKKCICDQCHETIEQVIKKIGHSYGEPVFKWSENYETATATFTCTREGCKKGEEGHTVTVDAKVTSKVKDGTITFTASAKCNGVSGTDKVIITISDENTRFVIKEGIKEIPQSLIDAGYKTEKKIIDIMIKDLLVNKGYSSDNTIIYDVEFQISLDEGKTWIKATPEYFPSEGCVVTLPYPEGIDKSKYEFSVVHMLTTNMNGMHPGDIENLDITLGKKGISFTVHSLSPITLSWKLISESDKTVDSNTATGDKAMNWIWIILLISGLTVFTTTFIARRNKRKR